MKDKEKEKEKEKETEVAVVPKMVEPVSNETSSS